MSEVGRSVGRQVRPSVRPSAKNRGHTYEERGKNFSLFFILQSIFFISSSILKKLLDSLSTLMSIMCIAKNMSLISIAYLTRPWLVFQVRFEYARARSVYHSLVTNYSRPFSWRRTLRVLPAPQKFCTQSAESGNCQSEFVFPLFVDAFA